MFSQHTCNIMWILFNWEKELILHFTLYRNISIAKYFQMPNFPQIFTFYEVGHLRKMDGGIKCYWIPSFVCVTKTKLSTNNNQRKIFFCFFFFLFLIVKYPLLWKIFCPIQAKYFMILDLYDYDEGIYVKRQKVNNIFCLSK